VQIAKANYKRNVEAAYFDDNYKITPMLSLQMGLRYELTPSWYDTLGTEFAVDMQTNHSPVSPFVSGPEPQQNWPLLTREGNCNDPYNGVNVRWVTAPPSGQSATTSNTSPVSPGPQCANGNFSNSLMQTDYVDFAPRIGISFQATPTMVIRSAFGVYFEIGTANARFDLARNLAGRVTNTSGGGTAGLTTINWSNAVGSSGTALMTPPYSFTVAYDHWTSNSQVWLLDIQKQFGTDWQVEAGYMGTKSGHLFGFRNANYSVPYGLLGPAGYYPAGAKTGTCTNLHCVGCITLWRAEKHYRSYALPKLRRSSTRARHRGRQLRGLFFPGEQAFQQGLQSDQLLHLLEIARRHQRHPHPIIAALSPERPLHHM